MLVGRWFQDKSYDSFSFDRDYTSFFPLGVTVIQNKKEVNKPLSAIEKGETLLIRTEEMIAADAVLLTDGASTSSTVFTHNFIKTIGIF
jgi:Cu+-exporting ATPase